MRHTITLTKWSNTLGPDEYSKKFQINPGFIVAVEELSASSDRNMGARTRVDYALPGSSGHSVLAWETSDQIDVLAEAARNAMREAMNPTRSANTESKKD